MAKAIRFQATGGPEVLRLEDFSPGEPGPGQVRMRNTAIGVNYVDVYHRTGLYPLPLPAGLGVEAVGEVEAAGPGVTGLSPGDRVASLVMAPPGAYAEVQVVPAERLVKLPASVSDEIAAAAFMKGLTVQALVRRVHPVQPGEVVLWHAAAGGVGLLAVQWLKLLGATVIGTVGSEEKAARARAAGCDHVIVYTRESFPARVREITSGAGVSVVYDSVGKATFDGSLDCLRQMGLMVCFGNASGAVPPFPPTLLTQKGSLFLTRPTVNHYTAARADLERGAAELFGLLEAGKLRVSIGGRWPLAQAGEAHRALEGRGTSGSLLLLP